MQFTVPALALFGAALANAQAPASAQCKTFPGDKAWPLKAEWDSLNKTVNGRLVATVPLGTPCHGASYDKATCESLQSQWQTEKIQ
jgi:hypothetical protein